MRGGGDLGSGVAHRLYVAGFDVAILELARPMAIRRTVAFASAVYDGECTVEGVRACLCLDIMEARRALSRRTIPVLVDPQGASLSELAPAALVDARLAKRNLGTSLADAPVVIGLGPGFTAGKDVHAVIETQRGHDLGRVFWQGEASADTGVPGVVGGEAEKRVLRAPVAGQFRSLHAIGHRLQAGDIVAYVASSPVVTSIAGVLRGIIHDGLYVAAGVKVGDVDPRAAVENCYSISDKARAIGGGVLEAILHLGVVP